MKKLLSTVLILAMALTVLTGCGGSSTDSQEGTPAVSEGAKEAKDTIIFAQGADITSLDPQIGKQLRACYVTTQIFDTLVKFDENMQLVPSIAKSWDILSDTSFRFNLRDDVKFHNGDLLTAEDVKYSIERTMKSSYVANYVDFISSVEIVDEHTVIVNTKEAYAATLTTFTTPPTSIIPKKVAEADEKGFALNPIGSGPYKFVEWKQGEYCKLEAFDDYFLGKPETKYVIMKVVPENAQRTILLETGEIDVAYEVLPNDLAKIQDNPELTPLKELSFKTINLDFNNASDGPLSNKLVRKAIEYAIDKKSIVDAVLSGIGEPASTTVAPKLFGYNDKLAANKFDIEKAKAFLAEAGYADGFEMNLWTDDSQTNVEICQVIQSQLSELGIKVNIEIMEYGTLLTKIKDVSDKNYDAAVKFFNTITGDGGFTLYNSFYSTSASNDIGYSNPEADKLLIAGRTTLDSDKRIEAYNKVYEILQEDVPSVSIYYEEMIVGINKKVEGFVLDKAGYHKYRNVKVYK